MLFKQFFRTSHRELKEKSELTVEDAGMHHAKIVRGVVAGLHEALQREKYQTETPTVVQAPVDHVANAVQNTQQKLATQLQKLQLMMQAMQMQFTSVPHGTRQDYEDLQDYGGCGYHSNQSSY